MSGFKLVLKYGEAASTRGVVLLYRREHLTLEPTDLAMTRGVVRSHAYPAEPRGRKAMADTWQIVLSHRCPRRPMERSSERVGQAFLKNAVLRHKQSTTH